MYMALRRAPCRAVPTPGCVHSRSKQRRWRRCTPLYCARCTLPRWPGTWRALGKQRRRGMRGGRVAGTKAPPAGSGLRSLPPRARSSRRSVVGGRPRGFGSCKPCWHPWASPHMIPIMGAPLRVTLLLKSPPQASGTRRQSSARPCPYGHV